MKAQSVKQMESILKRKKEKIKKLTKDLGAECAAEKKLEKSIAEGKKKAAASKPKAKAKPKKK